MFRTTKLLLAVAMFVAGGCVAGPGASITASTSPNLSLPSDVLDTHHVVPATQADAALVRVSEAEARASAKSAGANYADGQAYVAKLTQFGNDPHGVPIVNRLIWVLRFTGISVVGPDPGVPGAPKPPPFNVAYAFVDAETGDYLGATLATI
jgi:hypothetical protein